MHGIRIAFLVFHALAVDEKFDDGALVALGEHVVPAGNVEIGQGIDGEHPTELVEAVGLGAYLIVRGGAVQQLALLGYKFGYFRKKKLAIGTASVTGMVSTWAI